MQGNDGTRWKLRILPGLGPVQVHWTQPRSNKEGNAVGVAGLAWPRGGSLPRGGMCPFQQFPPVPWILLRLAVRQRPEVVLPGVAGALLAVAFFMPDGGVGLIEELPLYGLFTIATLLAAPGTRSVEIRSDGAVIAHSNEFTLECCGDSEDD